MKSPIPSIIVDGRPELPALGDILRELVKLHPDREALVFGNRRTSYAELDRQSDRVCAAFSAIGVPAGSRIAYLGKNSDLFFALMFGVAKAGIVLLPLNWRLAPEEIVYILEQSECKLLFASEEFYETAIFLRFRLPGIATIVGMDGPSIGIERFDDWLTGVPDQSPKRGISADDVILQIYTSGTTGRPKGAMLTTRNLFGRAHISDDPEWCWIVPDDVVLVSLPVGHIAGTATGLRVLCVGAKAVVLREFDVNAVLDAINDHRITRLSFVPSIIQIILRHPRANEVDFNSIKYFGYGASPIPLDLLKQAIAAFGCGFIQGYGMTETASNISALGPDDHDPEGSLRMRSVGRVLDGIELAIVDAEGRRLPTGSVGEIIVRSVSNMVGYFNDPEATAKAIDQDRWLHTGDAGYLDQDGYLYIHDRVKDMIISGGENVYPAEVENAIFGHPDVLEVAVIGVPDELWGEAVKAVVVPMPGTAPNQASIIAFARERIAGFKAPKSVDFVDEMPRNASGKVLRRQLREPYWADKTRHVN